MEILVCVKQVPDDSVEIKFDEAKNAPKLEGVTPIVNAFDGYALEMAARFKEAHGGNVTVVSLGTEKAKDAVRNCLAVGADKGFVIVDEAFEGSDTLATSYILSKAVSKIEEIKLRKSSLSSTININGAFSSDNGGCCASQCSKTSSFVQVSAVAVFCTITS